MNIQMSVASFKALGLAALIGAGLALSACSEEAPAPAPGSVEGVVEGIEVTNARMVLAPVAGNPAAVYFDVVYNADRGLVITGAEIDGTQSVMIHNIKRYNFEMQMMEVDMIALRSGEPVVFEPGALHLMAFEPDDTLQAGGTAQVTLKISGNKTHEFTADIRAAGEER